MSDVAWSEDGSLVAAAVYSMGSPGERVERTEGIVVWSAGDGVVREHYRMLDALSVAFSPDGSQIAFASQDGSGIVDRRTGCARRWAAKGPFIGWRSDGRGVFVAGPLRRDRGAGHVADVDLVSGGVVHAETLEGRAFLSMATTRRTVLLLDTMHAVHVLTTDPRTLRSIPGAPTESANVTVGGADGIAIAPDGALLAAGVVESMPVEVDPTHPPGTSADHSFFVRLIALPSLEERERFLAPSDALAFSPDGTFLAIAGARRLAVRTVATKETRILDDKLDGALRQVAWSPDGRTIALAPLAGSIRLYDARSGVVRPLPSYRAPPDSIPALSARASP